MHPILQSFVKFVLGFTAILFASFFLIFAVGYYDGVHARQGSEVVE